MKKTQISAAERINPGPKKLTGRDVTKKDLTQMVGNMFYGAGIDFDDKVIQKQKKNDLLQIVNNMASLVSRSALQSALGQSFNGRRDLYDVLGWKKELVFTDFYNLYDRNGIAARVVDFKAGESWRKFPVLHDGKDKADYKDSTPFLKDWLNLVDKFKLASLFNELDVALGISRFAVIVVGVKGTTRYSEPLTEGNNVIEFLRVLDEGQVTLTEPVTDIMSPRYGLPNMYQCQFEENGQSIPVHHTRVIHFKQGRSRSNVYGIPGLKKSFNWLNDLEKVAGSSSEAYWQHIRRVLILTAREGFQLPAEGSPERTKLDEQVENYEHQMRLLIQLRNMDVTQITTQMVDGRNQTDLLIGLVAGTEGIPQRILLGSERGELASSQDQKNVGNVINARQTQTCEPWLQSFVEYAYMNGFIPAPSTGKFSVEWLPLYEMTPIEKMDVAKAEAEVIDKITDGNFETFMTLKDFADRHFDNYSPPNTPAEDEPNNGGGGESENEADEDENIPIGIATGQGLAEENVTGRTI